MMYHNQAITKSNNMATRHKSRKELTMSKSTIFQLLSTANQRIEAVVKDEKHAQGYNFRSAQAVINAISPVFATLGIFLTSKIISKERIEGRTAKGGASTTVLLSVEYTFHAPNGSSVASIAAAEAIDYSDKATAKAMTMALKTVLTQTFMLTTQDMNDADRDALEGAIGRNVEYITEDQKEEIEDLVILSEIKRTSLVTMIRNQYKIHEIREIPTHLFKKIKSKLEDKIKENEGGEQ